jgi:hypothetical protein
MSLINIPKDCLNIIINYLILKDLLSLLRCSKSISNKDGKYDFELIKKIRCSNGDSSHKKILKYVNNKKDDDICKIINIIIFIIIKKQSDDERNLLNKLILILVSIANFDKLLLLEKIILTLKDNKFIIITINNAKYNIISKVLLRLKNNNDCFKFLMNHVEDINHSNCEILLMNIIKLINLKDTFSFLKKMNFNDIMKSTSGCICGSHVRIIDILLKFFSIFEVYNEIKDTDYCTDNFKKQFNFN